MKYIDFNLLEEQLRARSTTLLNQWLPGGKIRNNEYVCDSIHGGEGDSFGINLNTFGFNDFNGDQNSKGIGMINLFAKQRNISYAEAAKQLSSEYDSNYTPPPPSTTQVKIKPQKYYQSIENFMFNGKKNDGLWYYLNHENIETHAVMRFTLQFNNQKNKFDKTFIQWTNTLQGWIMQGPKKPKPLYNSHLIIQDQDKQIVLVEGEKCADAITKIGRLGVSWMGGANAVNDADWEKLRNRDVLFWPDSDEAGFKTREPIIRLLTPIVKTLKILDVNPNDFDAADMNFKTDDEFKTYAKSVVKQIKPVESLPQARIIDIEKLKTYDTKLSFPHMKLSKKGEPLYPMATIENVRELLFRNGVVNKYNVIKKRAEMTIAGKEFLFDTERNSKLSEVISLATQIEMPLTNIPSFLDTIASENPYNPIAEFIELKPWDGVSRLQDMYDTIKSQNDKLKELFMRKWFISAVAAAYSLRGVVARGVLVLQGEQNIGKTYWFKRLLPEYLKDCLSEGTILMNDKDCIQNIAGHWLVELGELDATFRKSDIAFLKSFISRENDTLRSAYAREFSQFARRTVFFASVNPENFLNDETGSTRFWTVKCLEINNEHNIDMQQFWAEIKHIYDSGETWHLNKEQIQELELFNEEFQQKNEYEDMLQTYFDFSEDWENKPKTPMTITQIVEKLGLRFDQRVSKSVAQAVRRVTGQKRGRKSNSKILYDIPEFKFEEKFKNSYFQKQGM